jgi:hypothetical protein
MAHTIPRGSDGLHTINFCPLAFSRLEHLSDLEKLKDGKFLTKDLISYESVFLHEIMHLDNVGYVIGFDSQSGASGRFEGENHNPEHSMLRSSHRA